MSYPFLKLIHILSATLMIGTGLGSAFYLYFAYKRAQASTVLDVLKLVNFADKIFTGPSVVIQIITGILLSNVMGLTYSKWFWLVISVSAFIFLLWLRALCIQYKLKKILDEEMVISDKFHYFMKIWFYLGIPSFLASIFIYYLMVYKTTF